jgi:hypothetical protein
LCSSYDNHHDQFWRANDYDNHIATDVSAQAYQYDHDIESECLLLFAAALLSDRSRGLHRDKLRSRRR